MSRICHIQNLHFQNMMTHVKEDFIFFQLTTEKSLSLTCTASMAEKRSASEQNSGANEFPDWLKR